MSPITRTVFAGFALLPTAFAASATLLASHFSGAVFTLSLNTQGNNGTLAITSAAGGCGSTPTWLQYYGDTKKLYCWDESWQGYGTIAEYNVSTDGSLVVTGQAKTTGNDVHGTLYGGPSGRSYLAAVE
jgi:Lactonase, 7-bladed beta-propeller